MISKESGSFRWSMILVKVPFELARKIAPVFGSAGVPGSAPSGKRPAHVLRTTFVLADRCDGRVYATAHGIYETFLNGCRVGDRELTPGFTAYWANLHVQVYDVGEILRAGENEWEVVLSDGWYRGRVGNWQSSENYGDRVAFLGQLHAGF